MNVSQLAKELANANNGVSSVQITSASKTISGSGSNDDGALKIELNADLSSVQQAIDDETYERQQAIASEEAARQQAIDDESQARSQADAGLQTQITANNVTSLAFSAENNTATISKAGGGQVAGVIPLASEAQNGWMPRESFEQIEALTSRVESLEQGGVWRATYATYAAMSAAWPGLDVTASGWLANDFVDVEADETRNGAATRYIVQSSGGSLLLVFQRAEAAPEPVQQATNTTLGVVKGDPSDTPGKVFVENDGSQSVIGWDALTNKVAQQELGLSYTTAIAASAFNAATGSGTDTITLASPSGYAQAIKINNVENAANAISVLKIFTTDSEAAAYSAANPGSIAMSTQGG
jgi:hypothetical protein